MCSGSMGAGGTWREQAELRCARASRLSARRPASATAAWPSRSAKPQSRAIARPLSQYHLDLRPVLGGEADLRDLAVRSIPDVAGDLTGHGVVMRSKHLAAHLDLLHALIDDSNLAIAPLDRVEQDGLLHCVRAPQAGGNQRGREIEGLAVVGAAQAVALKPERDSARLAVVVAF